MISVNLALPQFGCLPPNLLWKGKPVYDPRKQPVSKALQPNLTDSQGPPQLGWIFNPDKAVERGLSLEAAPLVQIYDRLLARLTQLEAHEENPHLKTDYRIAWLTVRFCQTGEAKLCTPQVLATYNVLGCHPDQVWFRIVQARNWVLGGPIKIGRVLPRYKTSALVAETGAAQSPLRPTATAPVPKKGKVA